MADPPQMAEEFLYELRKMIDVAKNRIRLRRHMPNLFAIPEDDASQQSSSSSSKSVDSYCKNGGRRRLARDISQMSAVIVGNDSSPRSAKSTDSGRVSSESARNSADEQQQHQQPIHELVNSVRKVDRWLQMTMNGSTSSSNHHELSSMPDVVDNNKTTVTDAEIRSSSNHRRRPYAVFPAGSPLKKSLPRSSRGRSWLQLRPTSHESGHTARF